MTYWPFWIGGLALAGVALAHWFLVGKLMSVSSRFTGVIDTLRGERSKEPVSESFVFFAALAVGGLLAALTSGGVHPALFASPGASFTHLFGGSPLAVAGVTGLGGAFVGFGTRMGTGCTSGHGLCGVARFEKGSLLATATFFGVGVAVSLALGAVR